MRTNDNDNERTFRDRYDEGTTISATDVTVAAMESGPSDDGTRQSATVVVFNIHNNDGDAHNDDDDDNDNARGFLFSLGDASLFGHAATILHNN